MNVGLGGERLKRLFAVTGKAEFDLFFPDLATEALGDQQLEIGLVIDRENFRRAHRLGVRRLKAVPEAATATAPSAGRNRRVW
jgi:hypothetical protein